MYGNYENEAMKRFRISKGKFVTGREPAMESYDFIGGKLWDIRRRTVENRNGEDGRNDALVVYDLYFEDKDDKFILSLFQTNGSTRDILRILYKVNKFEDTMIRINVWQAENKSKPDSPYTNASVRVNGQKIDWAELPKPNRVTLSDGRIVNDYSNVYEILDRYVNTISGRLHAKEIDEDMPPADGGDFYNNVESIEY